MCRSAGADAPIAWQEALARERPEPLRPHDPAALAVGGCFVCFPPAPPVPARRSRSFDRRGGRVASVAIRILLVDDHAMVRSGLRLLLEAAADFSVVAEAGDVDAALGRTRAERPDVVLLDLNMPGRATLPAIPDFLDAAPGAAVVVMTMQDDPSAARAALSAGASGYVLKEAADAELVEAVRAAAGGRTYLNPSLGARLVAGSADSEAPTTPETVAVGATFAGHRLEALSGRGGMGVVYRATDLTLDRTVALKLIDPEQTRDALFRERFQRECRLAAAIDHPHAVEIFHAGEEAGRLYVTMRYVEGTDLRALLAEQGRLAPARAVAIVAQVAQALDEAHRIGLVHRDVKPANILLARRRDSEQAYLTDFGLTKRRVDDAALTRTGFAIGTADYMSPEQARGAEVDGRSDVYSLGCVLFQALTGRVPYEADSDVEKMWAHVSTPPPALLEVSPGLPAGLGGVLGRALAKEPDDRQQTAGALAREARAALEPQPR